MKQLFVLLILCLFLITGCSTANNQTSSTPVPSLEPSSTPIVEPNYPLEIHATYLKENDYDLYMTKAYEITVTNHSDEDVILTRINTFIEDTNFQAVKYIPANDTVTFHSGLYFPRFVDASPKIQSYEYQLANDEKLFEVKADNQVKEIEFSDRISNNFVMNDEYTYFVDMEEGIFGFYPGSEVQGERLQYLNTSNDTLYDLILSGKNFYNEYTLINFIDEDLPFDEENLAYIERVAEMTGMHYVINNEYDYDNIKNQFPRIITVSLFPSKIEGKTYFVNVYLQSPFTITDEMKNNADKMKIPLEELPQYYQEHCGNIKGMNGRLTEKEQEKIQSLFPKDTFLNFNGEVWYGAMKPVIYLYDTQDGIVDVQLEKPTTLTYPEITQGWQVVLKNNRMFVNDKEVRYLYYEADIPDVFDLSEGFVIKKEDSISFLEDKLAYMGLNDLEINDFIVFWLPYLMENDYNFITFQNEIYADIFPIECNPKPDSTLRIYMVMQGLEQPIEIIEQELPKGIEREGFTLIEWGGSILK